MHHSNFLHCWFASACSHSHMVTSARWLNMNFLGGLKSINLSSHTDLVMKGEERWQMGGRVRGEMNIFAHQPDKSTWRKFGFREKIQMNHRPGQKPKPPKPPPPPELSEKQEGRKRMRNSQVHPQPRQCQEEHTISPPKGPPPSPPLLPEVEKKWKGTAHQLRKMWTP